MTDPLAGNGERVMRAGSVSGKTFPVDPLAGMTVKEARELVAEVVSAQASPNVLAYKNGCGVNATDVRYILALAAKGAEVLGAEERFYCFDCGVFAPHDDTVCLSCSEKVSRILFLKEDRC